MSDDFTQKEILLKVMVQVDSIQQAMTSQQLLLQKHIDASAGRDIMMGEIKQDIERIEVRVGMLEGFKLKAITIWGAAWSIVTLFAVWAIDSFFGTK